MHVPTGLPGVRLRTGRGVASLDPQTTRPTQDEVLANPRIAQRPPQSGSEGGGVTARLAPSRRPRTQIRVVAGPARQPMRIAPWLLFTALVIFVSLP